MENINVVMNNNKNMYYGHGTNGDEKIINSILNNGLRCSHGSLYFTSCTLGIGKEIDEEVSDMFDNWPHLDASKVVVISLPYKYNILEIPGTDLYGENTGAYCYIPKKEKQDEYNLTNSPYVRPEFILGYYDRETKTFHNNPNYYELLPNKDEIMDSVKQRYMDIIDDAIGLNEYKEMLKELPNWIFPLSGEDVNNYLENKSKIIQNKR